MQKLPRSVLAPSEIDGISAAWDDDFLHRSKLVIVPSGQWQSCAVRWWRRRDVNALRKGHLTLTTFHLSWLYPLLWSSLYLCRYLPKPFRRTLEAGGNPVTRWPFVSWDRMSTRVGSDLWCPSLCSPLQCEVAYISGSLSLAIAY
jgi:hypothetical protein